MDRVLPGLFRRPTEKLNHMKLQSLGLTLEPVQIVRKTMANFFVDLWQSIFQPGTTPQLIIATHLSFAALVATLAWLIYATSGNIHFIALFFISICLWLAVTWFIQELKSVQLKDNNAVKEGEKTEGGKESSSPISSGSETRQKQTSKAAFQVRSRKV